MFVKMLALVMALFLAMESSGAPREQTNADMSDPDVQYALEFAVTEHNKDSSGKWISHVTKVISAKEEVVAGTEYTFTVEMARTSCKKGSEQNDCQTNPDPNIAQAQECELIVWSQPWLGEAEVIKDTCP
ncbi:cystatin-like [Hoplias malabaricus]|uniref:cystatin-like n=1 Tax=Hoplias malabaricus TaxID=27720 RepID=UPI0034618942